MTTQKQKEQDAYLQRLLGAHVATPWYHSVNQMTPMRPLGDLPIKVIEPAKIGGKR